MSDMRTRIANLVSRGEVKLVDDSEGQQMLQLEVLEGEVIDDAEHAHPYGFTSVPKAGAEAVAVFPDGDRSHAIVLSVGDRRYRLTALSEGEVAIYNDTGAHVVLQADGNIRLQAKVGGHIQISDSSGSLTSLDELVHGSGIDSFTGATYKVLGNTSSTVRAKK